MLRTRTGLPKHCSWNADRHGTRRIRFRKGGFSIYLTGIPFYGDYTVWQGTGLNFSVDGNGEVTKFLQGSVQKPLKGSISRLANRTPPSFSMTKSKHGHKTRE